MSEIICLYSFANNEKESGYFILETNVELNDLKQFLVNSNIMEPNQTLLDCDNKPIKSEEAFTSMKTCAVANNTSISFTIASPVESNSKDEPFGPILKQILTTLNINYENITQLSDVIDNIPFPFSVMARGYLSTIRENPKAIEQIVLSIAPDYSSEIAPLIAEVTLAFAFFDRKEREKEEELARLKKEEERAREAELARLEKEREEQEQREREQQENEQREKEVEKCGLIGPVMKQILDKVGVEIEIDAEDIPVLLQYIPHCYRSLVQCLVKEYAENEYFINYGIRYVAELLGVPEEALVNEVQYAFSCVKEAVFSLVEEEEKEQIVHEAICDECTNVISGIRYKCLHCPEYDLCSGCEEKNTSQCFHDGSHTFAKIHTPSQTLPSFHSRGHANMRGERRNRIDKLEGAIEELKRAVAALANTQM